MFLLGSPSLLSLSVHLIFFYLSLVMSSLLIHTGLLPCLLDFLQIGLGLFPVCGGHPWRFSSFPGQICPLRAASIAHLTPEYAKVWFPGVRVVTLLLAFLTFPKSTKSGFQQPKLPSTIPSQTSFSLYITSRSITSPHWPAQHVHQKLNDS